MALNSERPSGTFYRWVEKKLNRLKFFDRGNLFCPVCERAVRSFSPLPESWESNFSKFGFPFHLEDFETLNHLAYSCPKCGAADRDRLYALFITRQWKNWRGPNISLLDFAPSAGLAEFIRRHDFVKYRSADLYMEGVDDRVDLEEMKIYPDNSFDVFICSHVLEHVKDDGRALAELFRILRPDGWGIVMAPIAMPLQRTDEDPSVSDEAERWRRFGQNDHVRLYARLDFIARLQKAGFIVHERGKKQFEDGSFDFNRHGIAPTAVLYVVTKQAIQLM